MKAPNQSIKPKVLWEINSACLPPHLPWLISFSLHREHDRSFYRASANASDRDAHSVAFPRSSHGLGSCRGCQAQGETIPLCGFFSDLFRLSGFSWALS
jgi:hypothetical protein